MTEPETRLGRTVEYRSYSFSKDYPADTDLGVGGQERELRPLNEICERNGGLFIRKMHDRVFAEIEGLAYPEQLSYNYLVGSSYVNNRSMLDGSGNSPKRHSIGTTVSCVSGTENEELLEQFMKVYGCEKMPPVWKDEKTVRRHS